MKEVLNFTIFDISPFSFSPVFQRIKSATPDCFSMIFAYLCSDYTKHVT